MQKTFRSMLALGAGLALTCVPATLAQNESDSAAQASAPPAWASWSPTWSDARFGQIAEMMRGSWRSSGEVAGLDGAEPEAVVMTSSPVFIADMPDAIYIETARESSLHRPSRQLIAQFYDRGGKVRMRTLEVRDPGASGAMTGMWTVPGRFPMFTRDETVATMDIEFAKEGSGWVGKTPYPYPTAVGGAYEMTSEIHVAPGRFVSIERGFGKSGEVVWGSGDGMRLEFAPFDHPFSADIADDGLVVVHLYPGEDGLEIQDQDKVGFNYTGRLQDGGTVFDTSLREGGRPIEYQTPGRLIQGWQRGIMGMRTGEWRKFVIPSEIGYGPTIAAQGRIPADSVLNFDVECVYVQRPEPINADEGVGPQPAARPALNSERGG